jgi:hypothetical protein
MKTKTLFKTECQLTPAVQKELPTSRTPRWLGQIGLALCAAVAGCTSYGQPSVSADVNVGVPSVEIRAESDFYEPLTPYGRWEVVGSYGRCWIPARVEPDWQPYREGYWQRTDAGWYWVSDEPWAWATYHYGRWDLSPEYGWYWMPQTQWAPAWVSWHSGGGYIGWAPLYPSARFAGGGSLEIDVKVISPRAYVFVEERRFLEPVSRSTVVINNTTIINKTVNITNTKIVNNTVINEGPAMAVVEKASGRKVQAVPVQELRLKQEAPALARQRISAPALDKKQQSVQTPVRSEIEPSTKKAVAAPAPLQVEKPRGAPSPSAAPTPTGRPSESEKAKPIPPQVQPRPEAPRPAVTKEPTEQKPGKGVEKQEKPAGSEKGKPNPAEKEHENKPKE